MSKKPTVQELDPLFVEGIKNSSVQQNSGYLKPDDANQRIKTSVSATTGEGLNTPPDGGDGWSTIATFSPFENGDRSFQLGQKWNDQSERYWIRRRLNQTTWSTWRPLMIGDPGAFSKSFGIGGTAGHLADGYDINNLGATGIYMGMSMVNAPPGSSTGHWAFVLNMVHADGFKKQLGFPFTHLSEINKIYQRTKHDGTWGEWLPIGGSGDGYQFISKVDARNFSSLISIHPGGAYDKIRLDFNSLGVQESRVIVLWINGVTEAGAYSGHRIVTTGMSSVANYAINTSALGPSQLLSGSLYIERRGAGEGATIEGLITVDGVLGISNKGSYVASTVEYHKGALKQNRNIISLMIGGSSSPIFNAGNIEMWGVPR